MEPVVRFEKVSRHYPMGGSVVKALDGVDLSIDPGDYVAVTGPSGSGKSTCLQVMGCLDVPTSGRYRLGGEDVALLGDDALSRIRGLRVGFVFQTFNLIPQLSVLENIEVPMVYGDLPDRQARERSESLARRVGLGKRLLHRPSELSGGEQQRVAVARSLANDPLLLLADEPTGNLDSATEREILALLEDLNREGRTLVIVTHSREVASRAGRVIRFRDGRVLENEPGT